MRPTSILPACATGWRPSAASSGQRNMRNGTRVLGNHRQPLPLRHRRHTRSVSSAMLAMDYDHRSAFEFAGADNVDFDDAFWRQHATAARGICARLWAAVASDGVWHYNGKKLQASGLEYGHGGGHQDWLGSMRGFIVRGVTPEAIATLLRGEREEGMAHGICRWDPGCERDHAYRAKAPTDDRMT